MSELVREEFMIDSDQKAEWALKKISEAYTDRDKWIEFYQGQIEKVKYETESNIENLKVMLEQYFYSVPHKETKTTSSYSLPGGKLILKKQQPEYEHNDEILVPWLEQNHPEFVKVKKSADWAGLKKTVTVFEGNVVDADAEVIPGVTVTERPEKFVVEVD